MRFCPAPWRALLCCAVQILGVHLHRRGLPLAPDVQVDEIAAMTMGFTGADLANLVNEVGPLQTKDILHDCRVSCCCPIDFVFVVRG